MSDSEGNVAFDIPAAFTGFVSFTRSDLTPGVYFLNPAVNSDLDALPVQVVTPDLVKALTGIVGSPQQDANGLMLLSVFDCDGKGAAGVSFTAQGPATPPVTFYSISGLPQANATGTDTAGYGGFVNVPPGAVGVTATINASKRSMPVDSVVVKAGTITYSRLVPR
jgi:hypothetical protein